MGASELGVFSSLDWLVIVMGAPKNPCRRCSWFLREHYHGPRQYGWCSLRSHATHANSAGCPGWEKRLGEAPKARNMRGEN